MNDVGVGNVYFLMVKFDWVDGVLIGSDVWMFGIKIGMVID